MNHNWNWIYKAATDDYPDGYVLVTCGMKQAKYCGRDEDVIGTPDAILAEVRKSFRVGRALGDVG